MKRRHDKAVELNRVAEQYERRRGAQYQSAALTLRGLAKFYTTRGKDQCSSSAS